MKFGLLSWSSSALFSILVFMKMKCHCKNVEIERKIIPSNNLLSSSTDSFGSPEHYCSGKIEACSHRGAVCASSCCTCKCRSEIPDFYSLKNGCVSLAVNQQGTKCHFYLSNALSFVPTFSDYKDLYVSSHLSVTAKLASISHIMSSGTCSTKTIYYINSNGEKKAICENKCSEVIGITSKRLSNKKNGHQLVWTYARNSAAIWQNMKGKLLQIEITCTGIGVASKMQRISSCLLFKVAGTDKHFFGLTKSPSCPTTSLPVSKSPTIAYVLEKFESKATNASSDVVPPATLSASQTTASRTTIFRTTTSWTTVKEAFGKRKNEERTDKHYKKKIDPMIIGVIIGSLFLLALISVSFFILVRKRYQRRRLLKSGKGRTESGAQFCTDAAQVDGNQDSNYYETVGNIFPLDSNGTTRPKMPKPRQKSAKNVYDYAAVTKKMHVSYPEVEQYADMSLGRLSENSHLFNADESYAKFDDESYTKFDNDDVTQMGPKTVDERHYENNHNIQEQPSYIQPVQETEYENLKNQI